MSEQTLNQLKVFVYGTLKPGESNYQRYCAENVVEKREAIRRNPFRVIAFGQLYE
jgi:gamma-glutamylcyclotransferase (GGCT)/AIG2-like uncharacterized protein YtfP